MLTPKTAVIVLTTLALLGAGAPAYADGATSGERPMVGPKLTAQFAELGDNGTAGNAEFASSVAISGTTIAVGAPSADGAGRVYVFSRTSRGWAEAAELAARPSVAAGQFGGCVAISGTTIAVGARGNAAAYIFAKTATGWRQQGELAGTDGDGNRVIPGFGSSVAVSDTTVVVGDPGHGDGSGQVDLFSRALGGWTKVAELDTRRATGTDALGTSVAASGTTVVAGAWGTGQGGGRAAVFTKQKGHWHQAAELAAPDASIHDLFGLSVAFSGTTIVVGSYGQASAAGRAYVFTRTGARWQEVAELKGSDTVGNDDFGDAVAVSGYNIVVGAFAKTGGGRAYVFARSASGWHQAMELRGSDTVGGPWVDGHDIGGDSFGDSVAVSGSTIVVGAPGHRPSGRAYLFHF